MWYFSDRTCPEPNLVFLNNALGRTGWTGPRLNSENWKTTLSDRLTELDWRTVSADALPFLENPDEADLLDKETIISLLE